MRSGPCRYIRLRLRREQLARTRLGRSSTRFGPVNTRFGFGRRLDHP